MYDYDLLVVGTGPGGQKAAIAAAKLGQAGGRGRAPPHDGRGLRQHRHHPVARPCARRSCTSPAWRSGTCTAPATASSPTSRSRTCSRAPSTSSAARSRSSAPSCCATTSTSSAAPARSWTRTRSASHGDARGDHSRSPPSTSSSPPAPSPPGRRRSSSTTTTSSTPTASSRWRTCPDSMVVVGAGVIGIEYASMFAALGTRVTVVDKRPAMLEFCDPEVVESLKFHLRDLSVHVPVRRGGRQGRDQRARHRHQRWRAASGSPPTRSCTPRAGRASTDELNLDAAGLRPTRAAGSPSTSSTAPRCRTSSRSAT